MKQELRHQIDHDERLELIRQSVERRRSTLTIEDDENDKAFMYAFSNYLSYPQESE